MLTAKVLHADTPNELNHSSLLPVFHYVFP